MCLAVCGLTWLSTSKGAGEAVGTRNVFACPPLNFFSTPCTPYNPPLWTCRTRLPTKLQILFFFSLFFFSFSFPKLSVKCHCLPTTLLRAPLGGWWQGCPPLHFSAFSLPHRPVQAGTLAVSCGIAPLRVGLTGACSGSFFSSCPLVTSQHHREKKNIDH